MLLFEHTLLESARFDQCRNRFSTLLYSTARPDAPRETSGEVRTTSGRTPPCDLCNDVPERPRDVLKRPWCINHLGPAGSRPALYAPLCLLFGRIPGNSAPGTTNLRNSSHNKLGGRKAHTPLSSADMHTVSCRFSLCAVELPASCAGAAVRAPASQWGWVNTQNTRAGARKALAPKPRFLRVCSSLGFQITWPLACSLGDLQYPLASRGAGGGRKAPIGAAPPGTPASGGHLPLLHLPPPVVSQSSARRDCAFSIGVASLASRGGGCA